MESDHAEISAPDALDTWVADIGEGNVVAVVELTRKGIADGTILAFSDKESFLQHLTSRVVEST